MPFPPLPPPDTRLLPLGGGAVLAYDTCGTPGASPAVLLHGGPGGGRAPGHRRFFDPDRTFVVSYDQRGCGASTPHAGEPVADLSGLTTDLLLDDLEALRTHVGVERWTVVGVSWGTTLALAYAQRHPERVTGLVLGLVGTTSRREVDWLTEGVGRLFPGPWEAFRDAVPERFREARLVDAYARWLADPDPAVHHAAALAWCAWEDAHVSLSPGRAASGAWPDPRRRLAFARLVTHVWRHAAFVGDQLVSEAHRLRGIPGAMVHGRFDVSSPLEVPWRLHRAWPESTLTVLDEGHGGPGFGDAMTAAVADVRARPRPDPVSVGGGRGCAT